MAGVACGVDMHVQAKEATDALEARVAALQAQRGGYVSPRGALGQEVRQRTHLGCPRTGLIPQLAVGRSLHGRVATDQERGEPRAPTRGHRGGDIQSWIGRPRACILG